MAKSVCLLAALLMPFVPSRELAAQDYVGRFDVYNGFVWFDSPSAHLTERGYHLQAGVNAKTWLAVGFDFSAVQGNVTLVPELLNSDLQTQIGGQVALLQRAGRLPPGYQVAVGTSSVTQTFAAGPQWEYRHFQQITLFAHPSIGAIHETATPHPSDPFTTAVVQQLAPTGKITDWEPFYGFGGGFELRFIRHGTLRIQADYVHNDLFPDILKSSRNTVRLSVGPAFQFGRNIVR
ncbi:MAG: hypothetical protein ACJ746_28460 [Bryobacteraceae bacterium]